MSGVMEGPMDSSGRSARRKEEVALRLLRGESLDAFVAERLEAPLARVCHVAGVSTSAPCEQRRRHSTSELHAPRAHRRPGPVGAMADDELHQA